jgi:23S rRNA (cytosine1962-C5)-methyltransferase
MARSRSAGDKETPPTTVVVDNHSAEWLGRSFPWVYPKEVVRKPRSLQPGALVQLQDKRGRPLGSGLWDDGWIAVRRFRSDPGPVDAELLEGLIRSALARREGLIPEETDAWRLVHAENDDLPGLRLDLWGDELHITLDSPHLRPLLPALVRAAKAVVSPSRVTLGWRTDPRDTQRTELPTELIWAAPDASQAPPEEHTRVVTERGLRFRVFPAMGSDAGLFCDMRSNRQLLDPFWRDRSVLNLFSYTGAFSVFAAARGARRVVTTDLAATALARTRDNLELNGLDPSHHAFERGDTFRVLDQLRRGGERFSLVLADPPPFSHGPHGTFSVGKDLGRLTAACLRVTDENGLFVLACNAGSLSPRAFQGAVEKAARKARRQLHLVADGTQPPDFPAALHFPEGRYLKLGVWCVGGSP